MQSYDKPNKNTVTAFTLVELLVVIAIIALLTSILMPSLSVARSYAREIVCRSNIRQLSLANIGYAMGNDDCYVPAASDMYLSNGGYHRWHGVRKDENELFDPSKGPLASFLNNGEVKECPQRAGFRKGDDWNTNYEQGCGGYGYNQTYIGSRIWQFGWSPQAFMKTSRITEVAKSAETIMFADCAMANKDSTGNSYIHEYSFAEPPFWLNNGKPATDWGYASPSIHFRHRYKANVSWVDGHVSSKNRAEYDGNNGYGIKSANFNIGWFEPLDNSLFDLK
ncbi:MAG: type II secretion system protein [Planctomycetes bacterium]|nr:type II secretion system protein [Planctomycetota bacterium]MBL7107192.1 type II secretion system protein [Phycisphaerae bacterium]